MSNTSNQNGKSVFEGLLSAAKQETKVTQKLSTNSTDSQANLGKRQRNGYRQTTIYVDKKLQKKVKRILEDSEFRGDFSDWIEKCMLAEVAKFEGTKQDK